MKKRMKVAVRTDASLQIGSGHLMRCLTLAQALSPGAEVVFLCRELDGHLCHLVESLGFAVFRLKKIVTEATLDWNRHAEWLGVPLEVDAGESAAALTENSFSPDWLVVDHYSLEAFWESRMRQSAKKIMVIDDLADRQHDCDLLLDQNYYPEKNRYSKLLPDHCETLLGPEYALIRQEFFNAKSALKDLRQGAPRVLVFFGGVDLHNETLKALEAVESLNRKDLMVDVVVGAANPHRAEIEDLCSSRPHWFFYCQVDNISVLMAKATVAVGAGGIATWERMFLCLPTIAISLAENQSRSLSVLAQKKSIVYLGESSEVTSETIAKELDSLLSHRREFFCLDVAKYSVAERLLLH